MKTSYRLNWVITHLMHGEVFWQHSQLFNKVTIGKWAMDTVYFNDKWLPQPSTFQVTSRPNEVPSDAKVSLLIDPHTRAWRTDMIRRFFSLEDASAILSILLSSRLPEDYLVWTYNLKDLFTMQSAYNIALTLGPSNNSRDSGKPIPTRIIGYFGRRFGGLTYQKK